MRRLLLFPLVLVITLVACEYDDINIVWREHIVLKSDRYEIYADGEQKVTFTVRQADKDVTAQCVIYDGYTQEPLEGYSFSTTCPDTFFFYAVKGELHSPKITIVALACDTITDIAPDTVPVVPPDTVPVVPPDTVPVVPPDTVPVVPPDTVPVVPPDTVPVVPPDTVPVVPPDTVPVVPPDTVPVVPPDTVPVVPPDTVPVVPPDTVPEVVPDNRVVKLLASASCVKANEYVYFTVLCDDADVTSMSYVYNSENNTQLNAHRFVTDVAGVYSFYAVYDTLVTEQVTITVEAVEEPPLTGSTVVFARGVSFEEGWYDVNKRGNGQSHGDINMCWAASASNIIEWWQDRYKEAGYELPEGAITGEGEIYELALMEMFHKEWDNSRGGQVYQAIPWYFEGVNICKEASPGSQAQPLDENSGGYYKEIWDEIYPNLYHEYDYLYGMYTGLYAGDYNNYMLWGAGAGYHLTDTERLKIFSDYVIEFMQRGMCSMAISLTANLSSLHHATTLWGYEVDNATGLVTKVWITDSDDMDKDPKTPILHEYSVSVSGSYTIKLSGAPYGSCYVVALIPVSGFLMF